MGVTKIETASALEVSQNLFYFFCILPNHVLKTSAVSILFAHVCIVSCVFLCVYLN